MNSRLIAFTHNEISKSQDVNRLDDVQNRSRLLFASRSIHTASIILPICKSSQIGIGGRNSRDLLSVVGHII